MAHFLDFIAHNRINFAENPSNNSPSPRSLSDFAVDKEINFIAQNFSLDFDESTLLSQIIYYFYYTLYIIYHYYYCIIINTVNIYYKCILYVFIYLFNWYPTHELTWLTKYEFVLRTACFSRSSQKVTKDLIWEIGEMKKLIKIKPLDRLDL